ncbi:uncharacterized protein [Bemisia tabaci]|uniref:uncharacterized protein isoform X2 n=1 Tax=Bemisia tabaci TaxID=7038 RepID=UPI003B280F6C
MIRFRKLTEWRPILLVSFIFFQYSKHALSQSYDCSMYNVVQQPENQTSGRWYLTAATPIPAAGPPGVNTCGLFGNCGGCGGIGMDMLPSGVSYSYGYNPQSYTSSVRQMTNQWVSPALGIMQVNFYSVSDVKVGPLSWNNVYPSQPDFNTLYFALLGYDAQNWMIWGLCRGGNYNDLFSPGGQASGQCMCAAPSGGGGGGGGGGGPSGGWWTFRWWWRRRWRWTFRRRWRRRWWWTFRWRRRRRGWCWSIWGRWRRGWWWAIGRRRRRWWWWWHGTSNARRNNYHNTKWRWGTTVSWWWSRRRWWTRTC